MPAKKAAKKAASQKRGLSPCGADDDPPRAGSSIAEKGDLDKLYQSMKYQAKQGNNTPLDTYFALTNRQQKAEFVRKWMVDKKFTWLTVKESQVKKVKAKEEHFEGWFSKYQIAKFENIPADSKLLEVKLAKMSSRAHSDPDWAELGEQEFFYISRAVGHKADETSHSLSLDQEGSVKEGSQLPELFLQSFGSDTQQPMKAIADGNVKVEPEEAEKQLQQEDWTKVCAKLKKVAKNLQDLCWDSLAVQGRLLEVLPSKPYYKPLLDTLKEQHKHLSEQSQRMQHVIEAIPEMPDEVVRKKVKDSLTEGTDHAEAFQLGAYREAKVLLK